MKPGNLTEIETYIDFWDFTKMILIKTYIFFEETARSAAKKIRAFRHEDGTCKGKRYTSKHAARSAARKNRLLFQRFLDINKNLHDFLKA